VPERGSQEAVEVWVGAERVLSSLLLYPEARSAIGRAVRLRRLRREELPAVRALAERLWRDVGRVGLTEGLARNAGELAEAHGLRGYDAVHLASAASVADDDLVLVSADEKLLATARSLGFRTVRSLG
jgi:hypothetical protein